MRYFQSRSCFFTGRAIVQSSTLYFVFNQNQTARQKTQNIIPNRVLMAENFK